MLILCLLNLSFVPSWCSRRCQRPDRFELTDQQITQLIQFTMEAKASHDFQATAPDELSFERGSVVKVRAEVTSTLTQSPDHQL